VHIGRLGDRCFLSELRRKLANTVLVFYSGSLVLIWNSRRFRRRASSETPLVSAGENFAVGVNLA
jgi:hypothetical protein